MRKPQRKKVNITLSIRRARGWQFAKCWLDVNRRSAIFARFWQHVKRSTPDACWPYAGPKKILGLTPQEFVWLATRDEIPQPGSIVTRCGDASCIHPHHLKQPRHGRQSAASRRRALPKKVRKG